MTSINTAHLLVDRLTSTQPNLTQLRGIAKEYGKDPATADYLWRQGATTSRLLALLMLDLKVIDTHALDTMIADIETAAEKDQRQLCDWLIANVIMKKTALKNAATTWRAEPSSVKQRAFWSVQARTIKAEQHTLNEELLSALESSMAGAAGMVQETMNWCAAQIGIADDALRERCIQLGERLGLYKDYPVSKGCTSPYLPIWITSLAGKNEMSSEGNAR